MAEEIFVSCWYAVYDFSNYYAIDIFSDELLPAPAPTTFFPISLFIVVTAAIETEDEI